MQNYLDSGMIPRGLRNFIMPSYESPNPIMLDEWASNSTESSTNMLKILVKYAKLDRDVLIQEISQLQDELSKSGEKEIIAKFKREMEVRLDVCETEIKARKHRKFIRDCKDYQSGCIYTFSKKYD